MVTTIWMNHLKNIYNMKVWQSEYFALNFRTGELERAISPHYFEGVNFEQGQLSLVKANMPWLRLTGNWFINKDNAPLALTEGNSSEVDKLNDFYEGFIDPKELTKDMSVDDFLDWLDISDELEDILATLTKFREAGMEKHIRLIVGHLKHKYGHDEQDGR